ncbi:MAG: PAS domain-containing sensor histidine kinase [Hyphomicrobiales bacterium]|nr:PAS domain-containing sensor histidine kinase [Hyphomicrobiales bacterium]
MRSASVIEAMRGVLDRLVHVDARRDRRLAGEHARFFGARLICFGLACAVLTVSLAYRSGLSMLDLTVLGSVLLLLAPVAFVSRTGDIELGHDLSSLLLSGSIAALALQTGGLNSPVLSLFAIVILDSAFCGSRQSLRVAILAGALGLALVALSPVLEGSSVMAGRYVAVALCAYASAMALIFLGRRERQASSQIRSQARAKTALDTVGDVVLWREAGGEISFANAAAHQQIGIDRRLFSEALLIERINVGDRPAFLKALSDASHGAGHGSAVIRFAVETEAARSVRMFEVSARRVGSADGEAAVVIVLRDVTERHAADELREMARLEAERIASSKSQFLATMSHELRTPLNAIIGFSELLIQPGLMPPNDPRRDEYARIINGSGEHLLEVVNAILDMSKIESGMMTVDQDRVDLSAVVASSCELLAVRAAEKSILLQQSLAPELPEIIADRRALKQIVLNLSSNAVKFTPAGGEVTVTAVRDRDHVEIAVVDTGCGIAEADLLQLGAPFFQARQSYDRQHEGTGLGLSVVRGLLGLMGGSMLIESAPGSGTRVSFRLPINGVPEKTSTEPVKIETRMSARRSALAETAFTPAPSSVRLTA